MGGSMSSSSARENNGFCRLVELNSCLRVIRGTGRAMPLLRSSSRLLRGEKITRADLFDSPSEEVIAQGRIVLCALCLLAVYLDPMQPGTAVLGVVVAYSVFAVVLLAIPFWKFPGRTAGYFLHAIDIAVLATLLALTHGSAGPFFAFFALVILLAAALRWDWRGVLVTAAVLGLIMLGATAGASWASPPNMPDGLRLNRAIVRAADLIAAGGLLAYFSALRVRRRQQLSRLADWPGPDASHTSSPSLAVILGHCARSLEVPRVLVLWEETEEPYVNIALWQNDRYEHTREIVGAFGDCVRSDNHPKSAFVTDDASSEFVTTQGGPARLKSPIIGEQLIRRFQIDSVGTAPFVGTLCRGRVFVLDRGSWGEFLLLLIELAASRIGMELDRQILQRQADEATATRERARLTRDLHDGILQSLTAARFQLKLLADGGEDARSRLSTIRLLLDNEQIRIRDFVRQTLPKSRAGTEVVLSRDLQRVISDAGQLWECATSLAVDPKDARVPASLAAHLSFILGEAISNAVRHGGASTLKVGIRKIDKQLAIEIHDNGRGINGSTSEYGQEQVADRDLGPVSLRERIAELGGSLRVRSSPLGTELQMRVPLG
jgi:signal transduction histidine kinase